MKFRIAPNIQMKAKRFHCKIIAVIFLLIFITNISQQSVSILDQVSRMLRINEDQTRFQRRHLASDRPNGDFNNCKCDITTNSCDFN